MTLIIGPEEARRMGHTTHRLAQAAGITDPVGDDTPGARWLRGVAHHVAEIHQQQAEGHTVAHLVRLHAHLAVEDTADPARVAADFQLAVHGTWRGRRPSRFAAQCALLPHAVSLLEHLAEVR